jgi:serine/threonine-protein kinase
MFQGGCATDLLGWVKRKRPVPPRRLQPSVPAALEAICLKCLEKNPGDRYPSAGALADALSNFLKEGAP